MLDSPFGRFVLRLGPLKGKIGEDEYLAVCQLNEPLVIERNLEGDWEIQSLNGAIDSLRNAALTRAVADWAKKDGTGIGFGAFTGFTLPSGAVAHRITPGFAGRDGRHSRKIRRKGLRHLAPTSL